LLFGFVTFKNYKKGVSKDIVFQRDRDRRHRKITFPLSVLLSHMHSTQTHTHTHRHTHTHTQSHLGKSLNLFQPNRHVIKLSIKRTKKTGSENDIFSSF
jgi:hypothetical protein